MALRDDDDNAAASIASGIAGAFAGPAASFAFGQMLQAIGLDTSPGQVSAQLTRVSAQLAALQAAMTQFMAEMNAEIAQLDYNVLIEPLASLITTNTTLTGLYQTLAGVDTGDQAAITTAKGAITAILTADVVKAPAVWDAAMRGTGGATGVIEAWNRVVSTHDRVFGPVSAGKIGRQWRFLDA